jgi:hypothetical protein
MTSVVGMSRARRTDHLVEAVTAELNKRRSFLNSDPDVRAVTISVKFKRGSELPRVVVVNVETEKEME